MNHHSQRMNALRTEEVVQVIDIVFHDFVHVSQVTHWLACLVYDEAGAPFVGEVFNAFG